MPHIVFRAIGGLSVWALLAGWLAVAGLSLFDQEQFDLPTQKAPAAILEQALETDADATKSKELPGPFLSAAVTARSPLFTNLREPLPAPSAQSFEPSYSPLYQLHSSLRI